MYQACSALIIHNIKINCTVITVKVANIGGKREQSVLWSKSELAISVLKKGTDITLAW